MKLELYLRFQKTEYSMEDDVPVNNETYVVILSISKPARSISWTQSIRDAHRSRIYIRSFIGVSVYTYLWASTSVPCFIKKMLALSILSSTCGTEVL
jgi:hypothetical protein